MPTLLAAFGGSPQDLGGYSDHNPYRLYFQRRFRDALAQFPDAEPLCMLNFGPGMWAAQVCKELKRPYSTVSWDEQPKTWSPHNWTTAQDLIGSPNHTALLVAGGIEKKFSEIVRERDGIDRLVMCGVQRSKIGGHTVDAARSIAEHFKKVDTPNLIIFEIVAPEDMPPQYEIAGAMEKVRAAVPDGLISALKSSEEQIRRVVETLRADGHTHIADKGVGRLHQIVTLRELLDQVLSRR